MIKFDNRNNQLSNQFEEINWIETSGVSEEELFSAINNLTDNKDGLSKAMIKAKSLEYIANKSRIAIDKNDIFQDKLFAKHIIADQRNRWQKEVTDKFLAKETEDEYRSHQIYGTYQAYGDYGHTSPNSKLLLQIGFSGLLERVEKASQKPNLTDKQKDFYNSCIVALNAVMTYLKRLADGIEPYNKENAEVLRNISKRAPQNSYEAMQTLIAYFFFHEYVGKTRVRTLGRLDVLLYPFYENDIKNGTFTHDEIKEMLKFFLNKFWAAKVPFDLPFCLGGMDKDGSDVTNKMSYLIVETYNELNIHSPKIHIRVSDNTPADFVKLVLNCIREGNSSFVFVNDNVGTKALENVGIDPQDAKDYVPIGCYEPAVWGVEMGCTGNGGISLPKVVELVITDGVDFKTGERCSIQTGKITTFEDFLTAIKKHIAHLSNLAYNFIVNIEKHYDEITPDPILSAMYDHSIEKGVDVYEGGAKYNNSSIYYYCLASLVDSICAVKKLVFEDKEVTFDEMCEILKNDWEGYEDLRTKALNSCEKYGNNEPFADSITEELTEFVASLSLNKPNGRGGKFKPSLFSIDWYVGLGKRTMATPDGRKAGEILSKNLCATVGKDKNGITALINSVTKIDFTKFPNGSVLDIIVHPSAVKGDNGLTAFYGILMTYFKKGGFAMHGNVFNSDDLKKAQINPEKYSNLQVRVCGWNSYFVKLSKEEQDAFIKQAENA